MMRTTPEMVTPRQDSTPHQSWGARPTTYIALHCITALLKQLESYCGTEIVILNRSPIGLAPSSPNICTTRAGELLTHVRFSVHQAHKHDGSSVESGFESGTLRGRDLTTRPPRLAECTDLQNW
ncbi:hypothetical protein AVEN_30731-1 [Araneus ventricosus]|uniref:Uncharacterized protein n=1 Tax=Araneus ventricosus TaxID=182803 RepID=A0A4Y2VIC5_ARAVE|nr:hypothetical protein AVEN_30731-1 [Araneus ventricosus]